MRCRKMEGIRSAGLIICILMVLMAYLKQAIPKGKSLYLMKAIISIFILLSIISSVRGISWKGLEGLINGSYSQSNEVWENAADLMEKGLLDEFQRYLDDENIDGQVLEVQVKGSLDDFRIDFVKVAGKESSTAKKLLAGRYQIGLNLIEAVDE